MVECKKRRVLLAGASGLVGGHLLDILLNDPEVHQIYALVRKLPAMTHPKLQFLLVNFNALPPLPSVDEVYLALGTTMKVAGSKAAFHAVDFDANLAVAKAALAAGATHLGLVSAGGANARSPWFYVRTKGELEEAIKTLPFIGVAIAQPSLLLGSRRGLGQPLRLAELIATPFARLFCVILPAAYKPVPAYAVARALTRVVPDAQGLSVLNAQQLIRLGRPEG